MTVVNTDEPGDPVALNGQLLTEIHCSQLKITHKKNARKVHTILNLKEEWIHHERDTEAHQVLRSDSGTEEDKRKDD